jgi:hypothetical protein
MSANPRGVARIATVMSATATRFAAGGEWATGEARTMDHTRADVTTMDEHEVVSILTERKLHSFCESAR